MMGSDPIISSMRERARGYPERTEKERNPLKSNCLTYDVDGAARRSNRTCVVAFCGKSPPTGPSHAHLSLPWSCFALSVLVRKLGDCGLFLTDK